MISCLLACLAMGSYHLISSKFFLLTIGCQYRCLGGYLNLSITAGSVSQLTCIFKFLKVPKNENFVLSKNLVGFWSPRKMCYYIPEVPYIYIYIYIYNITFFLSKELTSSGSFINFFLEIRYKNGHWIAKNRYVNVIFL